jgi:predicted nucleotidyltransferase
MFDTDNFGFWLRARRGILGLTQEQVAKLTNTTQSNIAAIESGARVVSIKRQREIAEQLPCKPSLALDKKRNQVKTILNHHGLANPLVFGSVARGTDTEDSDIDIMVWPTGRFGLSAKSRVANELIEELSFPVDIVRGDAGIVSDFDQKWFDLAKTQAIAI